MTDHPETGTFSQHLYRREMRQYLKSELPASETARVEQHLKLCEQCSLSMIAIVENEEPENYKKNIDKIKNKLKVEVRKNPLSFNFSGKKKMIMIAGMGFIAFSAFAFYTYVLDGNSGVGGSRFFIPTKPNRETPVNLEDEKVEEKPEVNKNLPEADLSEKNINQPIAAKKELETQSPKDKVKENPVVAPPKKAEQTEAEILPEPEVEEKSKTEISNSVLVARRKEPSETNEVKKVAAEVTKVENTNADPEEEKLVDASPSGGYGAFNQYVTGNLQYPADARENKIEGQVSVEFTVKEDGSLTNFSVKKPMGYGCDQEAIRLIKSGPTWAAATKNGQAVVKTVTVTVNFKLAE